MFAFEVVSLLLLAAVVGGIFLARRDPGHDVLDAAGPTNPVEEP